MKNIFKRKPKENTHFEGTFGSALSNDYKSQLKQIGVDCIKAPAKMFYNICTTSYWVFLALLFTGIVIGFSEPRIREVLVDIITRELTKLL